MKMNEILNQMTQKITNLEEDSKTIKELLERSQEEIERLKEQISSYLLKIE